jgi:hypothetical protein
MLSPIVTISIVTPGRARSREIVTPGRARLRDSRARATRAPPL